MVQLLQTDIIWPLGHRAIDLPTKELECSHIQEERLGQYHVHDQPRTRDYNVAYSMEMMERRLLTDGLGMATRLAILQNWKNLLTNARFPHIKGKMPASVYLPILYYLNDSS